MDPIIQKLQEQMLAGMAAGRQAPPPPPTPGQIARGQLDSALVEALASMRTPTLAPVVTDPGRAVAERPQGPAGASRMGAAPSLMERVGSILRDPADQLPDYIRTMLTEAGQRPSPSVDPPAVKPTAIGEAYQKIQQGGDPATVMREMQQRSLMEAGASLAGGMARGLVSPVDEHGMPNVDIAGGPLFGAAKGAAKATKATKAAIGKIDDAADDVLSHINFSKLNLDPDVEQVVREAARVNVNNPHLGNLPETPRVLGAKELQRRADEIDPESLLDLKIPGLGKGSLPPDVSIAVRDSINSIAKKHAEIQAAAGKAALMEDGVKHAELQKEADRLWTNMSKLVGLDYASANEAGRSLWLRRLMARETTEPSYWLGQISKKKGYIPPGTTPDLVPRLDRIDKAKAKVAEATEAAKPRAAERAKRTRNPDDDILKLPGEDNYRRLLERMTEDSQSRVERAIAQRIKSLQKEHDLRVTRAGVEHGEIGTNALKDVKAPKLTPEERKLVDADPTIQHLQGIVDSLRSQQNPRTAQLPENQIARYRSQVLASARRRLEDIERKMDGLPPKPPTIDAEIKALVRKDPEVIAAEKELSERQLEFAKWMRQFETHGFLETADNIMKADVLSGIKSHARNIFGTGTAVAADEIARYPSWALDMMMSAKTGTRTIANPMKGALAAAREVKSKGLPDAMNRLKHGMSASDAQKMDLGPMELNTTVFGDNPNNIGNKFLNTWSRINFRALSAEDALWRSFVAKKTLDSEAWAHAKTLSLQGKLPPETSIDQYAKMLVDDPPSWLQAEVALASDRAVFGEKNVVAQALNRFKRGGRGAAKELGKRLRPGDAPPSPTAEKMENLAGDLFEFGANRVFMFTTTPTNVVARVFEYMPGIGAIQPSAKVLAEKLWGSGFTREQQKTIADAFGRQMVGTGTTLMAAYLWEKGWLTGLPTQGQGEKNIDLAAGKPPMSVYVPYLDRWMRINEAAPFGGLMIATATALEEGSKPVDERLRAERMIGGALGVAEEMPLAQGPEMVARAMQNPTRAFETWTREQLGTGVPTLLADAGRAFDDKVRSSYHPDAGYLESAKERFPLTRRMVPPLQNVFGEDVKSKPSHAADPFLSTEPSKDAIKVALSQADVGLQKPEKKDDETGEQYRRRVEAYGQVKYKVAKRAIESQLWKTANPVGRKYYAESLFSKATRLLNKLPADTFNTIADSQAVQDVIVEEVFK